MSMFHRATRATARARVAFEGPSGSGKTWTGLQWATILAGDKPIAFIDTERGSASLYAKHFSFDVLEMTPPYHPDRLIEALKTADREGYGVVMIDSLSHFWSGEGGVLDIIDDVAARSQSKNTFAAWKEGSPIWKGMIDSILALDAHAIVTMRSKTEYVIEQNAKGRNEPRKVGLAPEARAGVEFEFTMVGSLEVMTHKLSFSKSRCDQLADRVFPGGKAEEAAEIFRAWLNDGEPLAARNEIDALVQRMNGITDPDARRDCKLVFVERFGRPESLIAKKVNEAKAFIEGYHGPDDTPPTGSGPGGGGSPPALPGSGTPPRPDDGTASTGTNGDPGVQPGEAGGQPPADPGPQYAPGEEPFDKIHHLSEVASIEDRRALGVAWHRVGHEGRVAMDTRWAREVRTPIGALTVDQLPLAWSYVRMGRALDLMYEAGVKTEAQRHALVREATDGRTESTKDLTDDDVIRLSLRASLVKADRLAFSGRGKNARWSEPQAVGA